MIQTVALRSNLDHDGRIPPAPVGYLLTNVPKVLRQCVSMAYQRRSTGRGKPPSWLVSASDVRVVDVAGANGTVIRFDAPRLGEAASELYAQGELWPTRPDPEDTPFDLLGDVLGDVLSQNGDSERFDHVLLKTLAGFTHVLNGSYQQISITGGRYPLDSPAMMDKGTIASAKMLYSRTPAPTRVRLVGTLDAVRISTQTFALRLDDGHEVQGVFEAGDFDGVLALLRSRQRVLVRGDAFFRPSGQLLLINAEEVGSGEGEPPLWSSVPQPDEGRLLDDRLVYSQRVPSSRLASILGRWPGDETDEEIDEGLRSLR